MYIEALETAAQTTSQPSPEEASKKSVIAASKVRRAHYRHCMAGGTGTWKSDLPSLLRRGSKLASSSCESTDISAMVTTVSLDRGSVQKQARKTQMFWR
jgi:hypothetical protein